MTIESQDGEVFHNMCDITVDRRFLNLIACQQLIKDLSNIELRPSSVDYRQVSIGHIDRDDKFGWLYDDIQSLVVSLNERFYRLDIDGFELLEYLVYKPGDYCNLHQDQIFIPNSRFDRKLSFLINLSDSESYQDGDYEILNVSSSFTKADRTQGGCILHSSVLPNRVQPVTQGEKHVIRGYVYGPKFR